MEKVKINWEGVIIVIVLLISALILTITTQDMFREPTINLKFTGVNETSYINYTNYTIKMVTYTTPEGALVTETYLIDKK